MVLEVGVGRARHQAVPKVVRERSPVIDPVARLLEEPVQLPPREVAKHVEWQLKRALVDAERVPVELRKRRVDEVVLTVSVERRQDMEGP